VPVRIDLDRRDPGVETTLDGQPSLPLADLLRERNGVEVRIGGTEYPSGGVEEILAVEESHCPFDRRFSGHGEGLERQYPVGGLAADPTGRKYLDYA
jgi:hypothetical protein